MLPSMCTGQGVKVCPYVDMAKARKPHQSVTHSDIKLRAQQQQPRKTSAQQALFEKTLSLYRGYRVHGCLGPAEAQLAQDSGEDDQDNDWMVQTRKSRRGHDAKLTCSGQLIFDYDRDGKAFVQ
jgi:hypothetical protein